MCGLTAIINNEYFKNTDKLLESIEHRGRNAKNQIEIESHFLGHTLLNTTDTNAQSSLQPMVSSETSNVVLFNGEIYNYKELKKQYFPNSQFKSNTDTEVVLKLFDLFGIDCLKLLNGDFAFLFYDYKNKTFYLARDRIGNKPLYYYKYKNSLIISSESRAIRRFLNTENFDLNYQIIGSFLNLNFMPIREQSFFKNLNQVKSGHYLKIDNYGKIIHEKDFWELAENIDSKNNQFDTKKDLEKLNYLINDCINIRSDCIFDNYSLTLSGGIDSNSILHYLHKKKNKKLSTYTFQEQSDEKENQIINDYKYNSEYQDISKFFFNHKDIDYEFFIKKLCSIVDSPPPDMSFIFNMFLNEQKQSESAQAVFFDGGGGDEAFFGHQHHLISFFSQLIKDKKYQSFLFFLSKYERYNGHNKFYYLIRSIYHLLPLSLKNFFKRIISKNKNFLMEDDFYLNFEEFFSSKPIHNFYLNTINNWVMPNVTSINDKIAGFYGSVIRTPFTDYRLYEYSLKFDYQSHFYYGTKSLLRINKFAKIPKNISNRMSKSQFPGGLEYYVKDNLSFIEDYCLERSKITDFIDKKKFLKVFTNYKIKKKYDSIFRCFAFFIWHENINNFLN